MKIFKKLEDTFAAAAFAEAGEFETAREMVKESDKDMDRSSGAETAGQDIQGTITDQPSGA